MIAHTITLTLSDHVFHRLQRMAHSMHEPLETVASQSLLGNLPPLIEDAPDEWRDEMAEMEQFSDEALWKVSQEPVPERQWGRHQELLERNQDGRLAEDERQELEHLRNLTDRFVFRRSYAVALLKWRGHTLFQDMSLPA